MRINGSFLIFCFVIVITFSACTNAGEEDLSTFDQVTLQLKWINQAQFAGFYVAQEQGYYTDERISVTFVEGGAGTDPGGLVAAGEADFGIDGADRMLVSRSHGQPVVAIAAIFRNDPLAFITMADSGITRPADFLGRTAGIGDGQVDFQYQAMMNNLGLDLDQVNIVPYDTDYSVFFSGEADITLGYSTGGLIRIRRAGYDVNLIWPSDYGVHLYADMLLTTDQLITENPDLVMRFLRATLKGWRTAIENPEIAVAETLHYSDEQYADMQAEMFDAVISLVHTGEDQIGWMCADVWEGMYQLLGEQNLLDQPFDVNSAYTMAFLNAVYGESQ